MINTIEEAKEWMEGNGRKLGAAYVLQRPEAEALMRIFGNYVIAAKDYPDLVSIAGEHLIGAINALETLGEMQKTERLLVQTTMDAQVKRR
jgi:hypothetical protein